ncbi:uncharacterized protein LOC132612999 [Lycium barbarum]|uniref:uncharacterized protein LOC132612999 n=1 Tax=Lycium barbarum TaxID=112863 RepID=UPI00293E4648|nr:uncharacterized protein LOC132612999 [Lycium barbarum]
MNEILPTTILPPDLRRRPGRPTRNRKKAADEGATSQSKRSCTVRCSTYKHYGHNRRTCQGAPVRAKEKKGKGYGQKQKGGPGLSTAGLSGAVLWEHATGNIPIVFSTQGNQSSSTPLSTNKTAPNASLNGDTIPPSFLFWGVHFYLQFEELVAGKWWVAVKVLFADELVKVQMKSYYLGY